MNPTIRHACSRIFARAIDSSCWLLIVFTLIAGPSAAADSLPTAWDGRDIGAVGQPGTATYNNGSYAIAGSGADIWGTADACHYVSRALPGSSYSTSFVTRVVADQNTNPYAKAGLMIRTSYDPSAAMVILDVKPDGGVEFMTRPSAGTATTFLASATAGFPVWLQLTYDGSSSVTGSVSADGTTWTTVGSATLTGGFAMGMAVTSHDNNSLNNAIFDNVHVTVSSNGPSSLPPEWVQTDVGSTGLAGTASYSNGTFTVSGAGDDIWGTADSFHFVYAAGSDVGTQITARVTGIQNTNSFAKAGLMVRTSLARDAADVILDVRPDGTVEFMSRLSSGATTTFIGAGTLPVPGWLRLVVSPGVVTGYISPNGITWSKVGDAAVNLDLSTYSYDMGLAVTSHDPSQLNTSTFDNVLINWSSQDVGNVGVAGSTAFANFQFTISGAGSDIWGTADSFHYVYMALPANSNTHRIAAYVQSLPQNTSPFAKAGVMIRDSLQPDAAQVTLDVKPDGEVEMLVRSATGGATAFVGGGTFPAGGVLILDMNGQTFTGRVCQSDATGCQTIGSATAAVSTSGLIGLAVTSHDPTVTTTATFSRVGID